MRLLLKKVFQILTIDCFKSVLVFETCFVLCAIQLEMRRPTFAFVPKNLFNFTQDRVIFCRRVLRLQSLDMICLEMNYGFRINI